MIADLQRFNPESVLTFSAGDGGFALYESPRQDFQTQRRHKDDRHDGPQEGARLIRERAPASR